MSGVVRAIYDVLRLDSAVSAIIGTSVFNGAVPAGVSLPYITISMVSGSAQTRLNAAQVQPLHYTSIQVQSYADESGAAYTLGEAVRDALDGLTGSIGTESLVVRWCTMRNRFDREFEPDSANDIWTYSDLQEYMVVNVQPVPTFA